jgi:hypothetical protein
MGRNDVKLIPERPRPFADLAEGLLARGTLQHLRLDRLASLIQEEGSRNLRRPAIQLLQPLVHRDAILFHHRSPMNTSLLTCPLIQVGSGGPFNTKEAAIWRNERERVLSSNTL